MVVIELGYVGVDDPPDPSPRASGWLRRHVRRAAAAVLAALCLLTVTASDHAPAPRGVRPLWSIPLGDEDSFQVSGDTVVVHSTGTPRRLSGYGRTDGAVRWSRELDVQAPFVIAVPDSGVVLLPSTPPGVPTQPDGVSMPPRFTETTAVDAATGAELWRGAGDPAWAGIGDGTLLVDHPDNGPGVARLRLVGLRDGRDRWRRDTPGAEQIATIGADPRHPDRVATVTGSGRVRLLRLDNGAEEGGGTVAWPPGSAFPFSSLEWHDGQLFVLHANDTRATVAAYGGQPLRQRWRIDVPGANAAGCGPVLCLSAGTGLTGHDWRTGAERWRLPDAVTRPFGAGLLAIVEGPESPLRVIDAATGQPVVTLAGQPVEDETGEVELMLSAPVAPDSRMVVTRVRPRTGETFTLGTIDAVPDYGCALDRDLLLCRTVRGRLSVTAVG
ncbi:putative pyrroloquinoline-quinone binding quinoprotein [Krasilnikovia cinnamomea]|uniref:Putative pyrroloquinoline-quinone binding quinoprotein n=1 Tax=Krasilnikovia cinnamomea TaxID=349313 RepID=A0A4V6MG35_9ACTN|nr:PQQ-binding-like beta-propeller repeat protein [Krasilnikovia cinnamomea]RZU49946.1 putative pyrroloquinoline-quinone binding quinoprotein [Krasilnikovia cinnamomea]